MSSCQFPEQQWADPASCPSHDATGWAIWKRNRAVPCGGVGDVLAKLKGWHPLHGTLVGRPGAERFVVPMSVDELREPLARSLVRSLRIGLWTWVVFACLSLAALGLVFTRASIVFATICVLGALWHTTDYLLLRCERAVNERTLFFYSLWFGRSGRSGLVFWCVVGLGMAITQSVLQHSLGGLEPLVIRFGAYYPAILGGEWWRIVSGPFFHSGILHFLSNLSSLILVGPMLWLAVGPRRGVLTFLLGSSAAMLAALVVNLTGNDSYVGVSGGVFALLGLLVTAGVLNPRLLPRGFAITLVWLAAILGVGAEMVTSTSTVGHLAGFATGVLRSHQLCVRIGLGNIENVLLAA